MIKQGFDYSIEKYLQFTKLKVINKNEKSSKVTYL